MDVLFLQDVPGTARRGEVKHVADGHARNYLIPRGIAVMATPAAMQKHAALIQKESKDNDEQAAAQKRALETLSGAKVSISRKTNEQETLFQKVSAGDIAHAIVSQLGVTIQPDAVHIDKPFSKLGTYPVEVTINGTKKEITLNIHNAS